MSKKDKSKVEAGVESQVVGSEVIKGEVIEAAQTEAAQTEAEKLEAFKAKKRAAAQRWKENRAKEKTDRIEKAKKFIEYLKANAFYDKLNDEQKAFINGLANPVNSSNGGNSSLFKTLFGDNPQIGASFTLNEAFQKTLKGKSNLDFYVKRWAEKGTIVTFKQDSENILNSVYTLEAMGSAAPADAE